MTNKLKQLKKDGNYSRSELANIFGFHPEAISRVMNSKTTCKISKSIDLLLGRYSVKSLHDNIMFDFHAINTTYDYDDRKHKSFIELFLDVYDNELSLVREDCKFYEKYIEELDPNCTGPEYISPSIWVFDDTEQGNLDDVVEQINIVIKTAALLKFSSVGIAEIKATTKAIEDYLITKPPI